MALKNSLTYPFVQINNANKLANSAFSDIVLQPD